LARAPALATLDGVIGTVPPDTVLGFSLVTLRRDLADLDERLAEQVRVMPGNIQWVLHTQRRCVPERDHRTLWWDRVMMAIDDLNCRDLLEP
jgi:hypothetical protein